MSDLLPARRDTHVARVDAIDIHPTVTVLAITRGHPVDGNAGRALLESALRLRSWRERPTGP